jgi:hypothetical protein
MGFRQRLPAHVSVALAATRPVCSQLKTAAVKCAQFAVFPPYPSFLQQSEEDDDFLGFRTTLRSVLLCRAIALYDRITCLLHSGS